MITLSNINVRCTLQNRLSWLFSDCNVSAAVSSILTLYSVWYVTAVLSKRLLDLTPLAAWLSSFRILQWWSWLVETCDALDRTSCAFDSSVMLDHDLPHNLVLISELRCYSLLVWYYWIKIECSNLLYMANSCVSKCFPNFLFQTVMIAATTWGSDMWQQLFNFSIVSYKSVKRFVENLCLNNL